MPVLTGVPSDVPPRAEEALPPPPNDAAVVRAERDLARVRASFAASVAFASEVAAAERRLWLARLTGGTVAEVEAWDHIAKIDQRALEAAQALLAQGKAGPARVWEARVRLHQSKRKAGHADEQYEELRTAYVNFVEKDHRERTAAGVASPEERYERIWMLCREFPLDGEVRDIVAERAGAGLRDHLATQVAALPVDAGAHRDTAELRLWSISAEIGDVDALTAHRERARIYERRLEALDRQRDSGSGLPISEAQVAAARVALQRERCAAGDENNEYEKLRAGHLEAERLRPQALQDRGALSRQGYLDALEQLEQEFPPPAALSPPDGGK